ncbi:hypothetical protein M0802_002221 [Mischocyttarus mexicanus]|nr:hypothetical protein M0802_002221 [Mischocyttarus mexicanus]
MLAARLDPSTETWTRVVTHVGRPNVVVLSTCVDCNSRSSSSSSSGSGSGSSSGLAVGRTHVRQSWVTFRKQDYSSLHGSSRTITNSSRNTTNSSSSSSDSDSSSGSGSGLMLVHSWGNNSDSG